MFASRIRATAEHLDVKIRFVRNLDAVVDSLKVSPDLIIVDLQSQKLDPFALALRLRSDPASSSIPLLGFYSHVMTEIRERAVEVGYTHVLPRSAFSNKLPQILSGEL